MILIRADANEHIGAGHIMRCLSIAHAFAAAGEEAAFITADHQADRFLGSFRSFCLDTEWSDMESETARLTEIINRSGASLLLIDSYSVTERYFQEIGRDIRCVYLDDMNSACWNVDCLINYNIFSSVFDYSRYNGTKTKLLLHPQFAPLRSEFRGLPEHVIQDSVKDVFVSAGGADPEGISERLMRELCPAWPEVRFHFVVGALNPRIGELKSLESDNIMLHIQEKNMSHLMRKCDLAISAAGTTLYELCAAGVPTITYTLADNQVIAAKQFEAQGIMISAGDCRGNNRFVQAIEERLRTMMADQALRIKLSQSMQRLVDGYGADRIVRELLKYD